jgi:hypothetical protein
VEEGSGSKQINGFTVEIGLEIIETDTAKTNNATEGSRATPEINATKTKVESGTPNITTTKKEVESVAPIAACEEEDAGEG